MGKTFLVSVLLLLATSHTFAQFNSAADGDWTNPTTWGNSSGGPGVGYPGPGSNITIQHTLTYDTVGADITYSNIIINSGSLTIPGDPVNITTLRTNSPFTLNNPLILGTNTRFIVQETSLTINGGGAITFADRSSIFSIQDSLPGGNNIQIASTVEIQNGIFAIRSTGDVINMNVNSGGFHVKQNGAFYLEGSGGTIAFNSANCLTLEEYGELVTDISGTLTVILNNSESIVFKSGSSYNSLNTGSINFSNFDPIWEVQLTANAGWRHISSPFTGKTLALLDGTDFNPTYSPVQAQNIYKWNAQVNTGSTAIGWEAVISNSSSFANGDCYSIYTGGTNFPYSNAGLIRFVDQQAYLSTSQGFTLYNTIDPNTSSNTTGNQGWNMIGNPYGTWLNLDTFLSVEMAGHYQGAHMWNTSAQNYVAYVISGESIERTHEATGSALDSLPTSVIRPFQAFWVKMSSGTSTTINIQPAYRSINPLLVSPNYFRTTVIPRLRLNAYAASDSAWDQVLVALNSNSSPKRLGSEDAFDRPSGNDRPNMALIHEDGEKLCIDSRPLVSATIIPMAFEQGINGATYHISMVDEQFDDNMSAFLEDVKTNSLHNLKNGAYTFTHDKSYNQTRFKIHLTPYLVSESEIPLTNDTFQVWTANDKVFVQVDKTGLNQTITLEVFSISGKLMFEISAYAESTTTSIPVQMHSGAGIIRVNHPNFGSKVIKSLK